MQGPGEPGAGGAWKGFDPAGGKGFDHGMSQNGSGYQGYNNSYLPEDSGGYLDGPPGGYGSPNKGMPGELDCLGATR